MLLVVRTEPSFNEPVAMTVVNEGGTSLTTKVNVFTSVSPPLSVTLSVTVYVPGSP